MSDVTILVPDDAELFAVAHEALAQGAKIIFNGKRFAIAKTIPLGEASGESLGIRAFSGVGRTLLMDELEAMGRDSDPATAWYITAVERIAQRGGPVGVLFLDSDACMDVDFEQDLERARREFGAPPAEAEGSKPRLDSPKVPACRRGLGG